MTNIPVSDPRLTALVKDVGGLDAPVLAGGVAVAPAPAGLSLRRDGDKALFQVGINPRDGSPIEVSVHIENEMLVFFPQRSSAHKQILASLGIND